mgnify:CR=1 FL=1|jgi:hypothetical protein|tara:strand:- start:210 stop:794 length:585 start_codon:yes stop_codon:yes gene_type:complete
MLSRLLVLALLVFAGTADAGWRWGQRVYNMGQSAGGCSGQTLIAQGDGTIIGDMDFAGGEDVAFDGTKIGACLGACAGSEDPATTDKVYIGKDWGAGVTRNVNGIKTWGGSNVGYTTGAVSVDLEIWGSNTAPTGPENGTQIKVFASFTDGTSTDPREDLTLDSTVAYRYHWLTIDRGGDDISYLVELEFYECT